MQEARPGGNRRDGAGWPGAVAGEPRHGRLHRRRQGGRAPLRPPHPQAGVVEPEP